MAIQRGLRHPGCPGQRSGGNPLSRILFQFGRQGLGVGTAAVTAILLINVAFVLAPWR